MNVEDLKARQAPLKAHYKAHPDAAMITMRATGAMDGDGLAFNVERRSDTTRAGLHPAAGGSGAELCSGDMLLEALVGCAGVTLLAVATAMSIELREARINAQGTCDFRGTLGIDKTVPVGFRNISIEFVLSSDASSEQLAQLIKLTERYCVVYQTLARPPDVTVSLVS